MEEKFVMPAPPQYGVMSSRRFHVSTMVLRSSFIWLTACLCAGGAPDRSVSEDTTLAGALVSSTIAPAASTWLANEYAVPWVSTYRAIRA
jgi:hypothetical protein